MDKDRMLIDREQIEARTLVLELERQNLPSRLEMIEEDARFAVSLYYAHLPTAEQAARRISNFINAFSNST
jgi:hypothetical protein